MTQGQATPPPAPQAADAPAGLDQFIAPEMQAAQNEDQYGGLGEQAKTFGEGALNTLTFGAGTALERALGVKSKDIRGRSEANPITHTAGEFAGLLSPIGEGAAAASIGEHAAAAVIPEATNVLQKVGSAAVRGAVENAIIGTGDEVSKAIAQDPDQTLQTALVNIGLSGLIGAGTAGALGTVSPLWEATVGPKAQDFLQKIQNRANGETIPISEDLSTAIEHGLNVPDEVKAGLSGDPKLQQTFNELRESGTMSGEALREGLEQTKEGLHEQLQQALATPTNLSPRDIGDQAKNDILNEVEQRQKAVREKYAAVNPSGETIEIPDDQRLKVYDKLIDMSQQGANGSPKQAIIREFAERVLSQDNVAHLDELMAELNNRSSMAWRAGDKMASQAYGAVRETVRDFQDQQIARAAKQAGIDGAEHAEAIGKDIIRERREARAAHGALQDYLEDIAGVSKAGRAKNAALLEESLEKIPSEKFAQRLFDPKNSRGLELIKRDFPKVFENLKNNYKNELLAAGKTSKGNFNPNAIFGRIDDLSKEMKSLIFKPEELQHIEGIRGVLKQIPDRINPSGTARTLDTLWRHMPTGGGAVAGMLAGHNPLVGLVLGQAAKYFGRDVPDAMKLSLLKFLGSSGPVDASAWKTAADLIEHAYKGQALIEKSTKAVFKAGQEVLPQAVLPSQKDTDRLKKKLEAYRQDPTPLLDVGGKTGYYMPEHAQAIGSLAAQTVNYLNSVKPKPPPALSPLDAEMKVSKADEARWNRTLEIAQQPLMVLEHMKRGELQPVDVVALQHMYPKLYSSLSEKLMGQIVNQKTKNEPIPYKTRMSLSLFMGQPLDSTMTPQAFMATQQVQSHAPPQMPQGPKGGGGHRGSMKMLGDKSNAMFETPIQSREMNRQGRA